jgi:hypothetical protein
MFPYHAKTLTNTIPEALKFEGIAFNFVSCSMFVVYKMLGENNQKEVKKLLLLRVLEGNIPFSVSVECADKNKENPLSVNPLHTSQSVEIGTANCGRTGKHSRDTFPSLINKSVATEVKQ